MLNRLEQGKGHRLEQAKAKDQGILRRKLRAERAEPEEQVMSPARAARMALARAADQSIGLPLRVGSIRQSRLDLADVLSLIEDSWALFPLVHDDGSIGGICLDPRTVFALVEQQTMGRLRASFDAGARDLTRTDKALMRPWIDMFLRQFDSMLDGAPTAFWTQGYHCDDPVANRHMLALGFDAQDYRLFDVSLEFVGTERHGAVTLILPIKSKRAPPSKAPRGAARSEKGDRPNLQMAALPAQVELDAILCRVKLPLADVRQLRAGKTLTVRRDAMQTASLVDPMGKTAIPVHLGQLHGARAVRIKGQRSGALAANGGQQDAPKAIAAAQNDAPVQSDGQMRKEGEQTDAQTDSDAQADAELDALLSES